MELAEPAGGWEATLNGKPLTPVASSAGSWAQAFRLPAGGGVLNISRDQTGRDLILALELLAVVAVAVLALPGSRAAEDVSAPAGAGSGPGAVTAGPAGGPAERPVAPGLARRRGRRRSRWPAERAGPSGRRAVAPLRVAGGPGAGSGGTGSRRLAHAGGRRAAAESLAAEPASAGRSGWRDGVPAPGPAAPAPWGPGRGLAVRAARAASPRVPGGPPTSLAGAMAGGSAVPVAGWRVAAAARGPRVEGGRRLRAAGCPELSQAGFRQRADGRSG